MDASLLYAMEVECVGVVARIALNGIDVLSDWEGARRREVLDVNPYVIEGSNHLEVFLTPMTDDAGRVVGRQHALRVRLYRLTRGRPLDEGERLAQFAWSEKVIPVAPGVMTGVWARQFTVAPERAFGRWSWQDAAPPSGDDDALELVALAEIIHGALSRKDADAVLDLTALRDQELARAKGVTFDEQRGEQRSILRGWFGSPWWALDPFDPTALAATPFVKGRVVRVTDPLGGAPIKGTDGVRRFTFGFMAARVEGSWTIVR